MITLLGGLFRLGLGIVANQFRIVLMGVAAQKAIVTLEPAAEGPPVVGAGRRHRLLRGQVPLAEAVGVVPLLEKDLRKEAVLERDVAVRSRIPRGAVREARQVVGMVIPARDDAGAGRRTERRRVHAAIEQTIGGQGIDVRGFDGAAVASQMAEAGVIENDEEDVRRSLLRPVGFGPGRLRDLGRASDHARECCSWFVLCQCHGCSSF